MDCNAARRLIEADVDGELDLVRHLELEEHLKGCAECARLRDNLRQRKAVLRAALPRYAAPAHLDAKIRRAISAARPAPPTAADSAQVSVLRFGSWPMLGLAASLAAALLVGYVWGGKQARQERLVAEAVSEHIRSLQLNHLSDVVSTDQHTVRPWFAGKLDFAPPVPDLASIGFPLVGGRLDRIADKPAAALVYRRRLHALNVFIWKSGSDSIPMGAHEEGGYHTRAWSENGFNYLAVSEISAEELKTFTVAFQAAIH